MANPSLATVYEATLGRKDEELAQLSRAKDEELARMQRELERERGEKERLQQQLATSGEPTEDVVAYEAALGAKVEELVQLQQKLKSERGCEICMPAIRV